MLHYNINCPVLYNVMKTDCYQLWLQPKLPIANDVANYFKLSGCEAQWPNQALLLEGKNGESYA